MICGSKSVPINEPGQPLLTRSEVWGGLVLKAHNGMPFVSAMSKCVVVAKYGETSFDREVRIRDEDFRERVTMDEPHRVVFARLSGPVLGTITNEIIGDDDDLKLCFSFAMVVSGVPGGSDAEREFGENMANDFMKGSIGTRDVIRRIAVG
ncbi:SRPBCC family protein [Amycolatopsis sp. lyj-90]|uniref:SRPBCC family protein n=1 Tax=Amycolatopsis sp. lyj-90 TaxID=2789285 RepID=UPI003978DC94